MSALGNACEEGLDARKDAPDDHLDPLGGGMQAVGLVEAAVAVESGAGAAFTISSAAATAERPISR